MRFEYNTNVALGALRRWLIAQCYDSLLVSAFWLAALVWLRVPWAVFWALVAGGLQWVPIYGPLMALLGPAMSMLLIGAPVRRWFGLLGAYAAIHLLDGLVLQPYLMKRKNRVPIWASLLTPILLGIVLPFWGVLLAPPLLAVAYAYRVPKAEKATGEQKFSRKDEGIILPPEEPPGGKEPGQL